MNIDKKTLAGYRHLILEIEQLEEEIQRNRAKLQSPKIAVASNMPKAPLRQGDTTADGVAVLADMDVMLRRKIKALSTKREAIELAISGLEPKERALMRYRYIDGLRWEEVCVKMNYEWRHVHRIHGNALIQLRGK